MIDYERYSWWKVILTFNGSVLPNILGRLGTLTLFSIMVCAINDDVLSLFNNKLPTLNPIGHTILGTSLGLLIVFRTNSSNSRYWEGRSHWGMMVNTCRSLTRIAKTYCTNAGDFATMIIAYVVCVKENLRGTKNFNMLTSLLSGKQYEKMIAASNPPSIIALYLSGLIKKEFDKGQITAQIAERMEEQVIKLLDSQGGCEKILKTPLPFVYASLIKQLLFIYLYTLPFVLASEMDWATPLVVAVVGFGMLGIEEAGVEIENPFGMQLNDLPLEKICETISFDVTSISKD
ncbi:MAG: bestrophin family protein [Gemmataceae bacterium]